MGESPEGGNRIWPPMRCVRVPGGGFDFGDTPAGVYTFYYMKGAYSTPSIPDQPMLIDFSWDCPQDLDVKISFAGEDNGYYCWYSCPEEYVVWYGRANVHDCTSGGSPESYLVDLKKAWDEGLWTDSTIVTVGGWWWRDCTNPTCDVTIRVSWGIQESSKKVPGSTFGKMGRISCDAPQIGFITAYQGGYFEVSW